MSRIQWPQVVLVLGLVAGGVALAIFGNDGAADSLTGLAGAALAGLGIGVAAPQAKVTK